MSKKGWVLAVIWIFIGMIVGFGAALKTGAWGDFFLLVGFWASLAVAAVVVAED